VQDRVVTESAQVVGIFLHLDKHLEAVVQPYGMGVCAIRFAIIFGETGRVVMPVLPGDALLFVCGTNVAIGGLSLPALYELLRHTVFKRRGSPA
jgi:membrane-associated protein